MINGAEKFESDSLTEAYFDRNQAVMAFAVLAEALGHTVGLNANPDDCEWPILYIDLPTGQVSWHLPIDEVPMNRFSAYPKPWDGHDLAEKRKRIDSFLAYYYPCGSVRPIGEELG